VESSAPIPETGTRENLGAGLSTMSRLICQRCRDCWQRAPSRIRTRDQPGRNRIKYAGEQA